jgi:uncharacterized protein (TIGR03067 family)
MQYLSYFHWSAVYFAFAGGSCDLASLKDIAALQGEWNWVAIESRGSYDSPDEIKGQKWIIAGNKITAVVPRTHDHRMIFLLDATKSPKQMDFAPRYEPEVGTAAPVIYELEPKRLRVAISMSTGENAVRPSDFNGEVMIFEKAMP